MIYIDLLKVGNGNDTQFQNNQCKENIVLKYFLKKSIYT